MSARKTWITFLLGIVMSFALMFGVAFALPKSETAAKVKAENTYTTKDVAMMGRVAGWYGNGNFEINLTIGECDWAGESGQKNYNGQLKNLLNDLDFFNHIKLGDKTLAEWGCTACYDNIYWLNSGEPKYTLMIPLAMGAENMAAASAAGIGGGTPFTVLEGALIPSYAYLQGNTSATVYRAGCDYVSSSSTVTFSIESAGKTDVESVKYVQGYDGTSGYFGVSLFGDDYAGSQLDVVNHGSGKFAANRFEKKVLVNNQAGLTGNFGLYGLGEKGQGYFAFQMFMPEEEMESITIPAGTTFPTRAMSVLRPLNGGNGVYMMYETQTDVTFYKQPDGSWSKDNLAQVKADAIAEISAYKSNASYEEAVAAQKAEIIANAISAIEAATTESEVESIVANAKAAINRLPEKTTYTVKDIAMMGRVAGWYGNGNFEIRITLGEADWSSEATKNYNGEADLPTALKKLDFFNKIMLGDKTLAEWGCTTCYNNTYWVNNGEPDYTLMIPLSMGANMSAASNAGIAANYPITILEGALIPSDAYLQGDVTATVYKAGSTFVTATSTAPYGIESVAKTEVESVKYVQAHDGNNGYFGISLVGDDYLGDGSQLEVNQNYSYDGRFDGTVLVNGEAGKVGYYGLFNLGSEGKGYYSFVMKVTEADMKSITIPAGTRFPSRAMTTLRGVNGNPVYIMYEVESEITFYKQADGSWSDSKPEGDFDTAVTQVQFGRSTNVINFNLGVNDYPAPDGSNSATYNIGVDVEKILSLNFLDNVIVDGYTLRSRYNRYGAPKANEPWIWVNKFVGHNFAILIPTADGQDIGATKIVIRAGTQFPSMDYINSGAQVFYVTTEEVTHVRVSDNVEANWAKQSKISFVADGDTIETLTYTMESGIKGEIPEVPSKEGFFAAWESYTLNGNDIIVNAVYTEHGFTEIETNLSSIKIEGGATDNFTVFVLSAHDYPTELNDWNAGVVSIKDFFANGNFYTHVLINGQAIGSTGEAYLNIWGNKGALGIRTSAGFSATEITVLAGCLLPSYAYLTDASNKTCYVLTEDVTFLNENGVWVRQGDTVVSAKPEYDNDYILSELHNTGHSVSAELEKGYLYVDNTTGGKVYGYNTSQSFSLTFDFSLNLGNSDISAQGKYTVFAIALATRGYNGGNAFGWNFYLYRPDNGNKCVEFFVGGAGQGAWEEVGIFEKGQTYRVTLGYKLLDSATGTVQTYVNINGSEHVREIVLGEDYYNTARYVDSIAFSSNTAITKGVLISDPGFVPEEDGRYNITLSDGEKNIVSEKAWKYTLPELNAYECGKPSEVFIGWTVDGKLYPAGYNLELTKDTKMSAVWITMSMRSGAAVRTVENESGLRFLVDINGKAYTEALDAGLIVGAGTLVVPTTYLDGNRPFVHESFPKGYYVDVPTDNWVVQSGNIWTYAAALINISPAQYTRSMSARGYLKIAYSDGTVDYVYTAYSKDLHARSIYDVATAAYMDNKKPNAVLNYVNSVADITIDGGFAITKNESGVGNYNVSVLKDASSVTLTFDNEVKALVINGERILAGYEAEIVIGGSVYVISNYKMASSCLTITFAIGDGDTEAYYAAIADYYKNSNDYTQLHKNEILSILDEWAEDYSNAAKSEAMVAKLERVKTEAELRGNVGASQLATPVVTNGLGYTVTWGAVDNADYYFVTDDNDYRNGVYVLAGNALTYKTEVVGKHNVTVTAYSFYEEYATSKVSNSFAAIEVKPVFSYKAMYDGLYKFSADNMVAMGIVANKNELNTNNNGTSYYYDKEEKLYFAYYNTDTGWSKNQANATDWTSPAEFPAHAARLKAMGNNVIMMSEGSTASLGADDVWETSRTKYIMDTAWTLGMKVIVCDDVLYKQSKKVESNSDAISVINGRLDLLKKYIKHPAFFGFSLEDEPEPNSLFTGSEMESVGIMVQALKETCANLGYSKANSNEPFFLACLYQYSSGFEDFGAIVGYEDYLEDWFDGTSLDYVYVDLYTGHAMGDKTNRYEMTYDVLYGSGTNGILGEDKEFFQVITAHTQNKDKTGVLTEADLYMSMLYAAAHNVAGYSWFCYFPIIGETAGSMVGFDGNGYGNGSGNSASGSYYNAAKTAGYQYELVQGVLNGYKLKSRSYSNNLLTTTLTKSGAGNITMYVNADTMSVSSSVGVSASGSVCYLVGIGVGTEDAPYQVVSGNITLQPGQAVICVA